ncbi:MAG: hypothetical protein HZB83_08480 [Deltaproteobacteria bacterium]|nr:hypothetical protein [Deltaproteobacteria bacterium]
MLNSRVVSLSFSLTMELIYVVCALFSYIAPDAVLYIVNTWVHAIDVTKIIAPKAMGLGGLIMGFITIFIGSYIAGAVFTAVYNALAKKSVG